MESTGKILMERYEVGRLLGKGTFGKVHYAKNLESNESVAIKMMDKDKVLKAGLSEQIRREITTMRLVAHKNIVELHEVMATRNNIYFVMEYVKGGELFDKIGKSGKLTEAAAHKYFQQLIGAVDYCHSRGVYHRDLKPENLLLDENENLKVSDFGLSALSESKGQDGLLHTTCGTPAYVAPEVISKTGYDGAKSDIWSCGVVLFVLVAGYLPFRAPNMMEMYRKIQNGDFRCPSWFSHKLKKLLYKILDPSPDTRISVQKIKESTWFRKGPVETRTVKEKILSENDTTNAAPAVAMRRKKNVHEDVKPPTVTSLNAFEIISFSTGLDLSGLFIRKECKKETRFTSDKGAVSIISKLEDVAKALNLRVRKKDNGVVKIQGRKVGRKGVLEFDTEIFEITASYHLIEMKQTGGDSLEYKKLLEEDIRPALKDIVWAWHGDDQQQK
ncbi:CBL-interacting protein kinase 14 [Zea mays]|jgi:5'-AMP-activated protein kinase, catalytic alpha subunit|uniref:non-specific serine/threonine protein kinase n=3 Tax=Zea mays TaxID=4577 RepID=B4FXZ1_MAIZE|nr:CBL-interacting protein kinase [Zea mays]XP_020406842.1 CBL-interacting protein kinase isoform X1 [Zea mays]ACF86984.1 unknown [Zea mays]ACG46379.1 CBL-interacting serine/threonine-protein kinase 15 [Zea mays]AQK57008.1 CBL-interacting serine/threonine-protein kinase 10 [Zea mays]PWZ29743.1 CBL-interacting protein kinase 14 [Zea mays]|eukprot:NP_001108478.2 CBL-interacting protein kinase [Zea mays]